MNICILLPKMTFISFNYQKRSRTNNFEIFTISTNEAKSNNDKETLKRVSGELTVQREVFKHLKREISVDGYF